MNDDDFYIPTSEELDRGEVKERRGLFARIRDRRASTRAALKVRDDIGSQKTIRTSALQPRDDLVDRSGSTGRAVRSIDASDVAAGRQLIVPPELRKKYGLDDSH